jgi:O-acetyl-ADP-ribose deacetylase (regulator of RNase III)
MNSTLRNQTFSSGIELHLIQGDITLADVECVVNPANQNLRHRGGLARLISRKAGPGLQDESKAWVKKHGRVSHDSPAYTSAGNLPFRYVIHAVGPVWGSGHEKIKLSAAVTGSLILAEKLGINSLALPAISTGIFGYPLEEASNIILVALKEHAGGRNDGGLDIIQMVIYDQESASVFSSSWDRLFS